MKYLLTLIATLNLSCQAFAEAPAAFAKTLAYGNQNWTFKNAALTVRKLNITENSLESVETAACFTLNSVSLKGEYPIINLAMGPLACDRDMDLTLLNSMVSELSYRIRANSNPDDSSRFELTFEDSKISKNIYCGSQQALQAMVHPNRLYLDYLITHPGTGSYGVTGYAYFFDILFQRESSSSPVTMKLRLISDNLSNGDRTEMELVAQLLP